MSEHVTSSFATVGPDGPPVDNVSGSVTMTGSTVRPERDVQGRWKPRASRIVGPLGPPGGVGPGGTDAVPGRWIKGVRDNSQLGDLERVHAVSAAPYFEVPDYSAGVSPSRKSNDGLHGAQALINHAMDCPACAIGTCHV